MPVCVCACVCSPATKYSNWGQSSFKLTLRSGSEASVLLWALRDDGVLLLGRDEKMSVCARSGRDVLAVLAVAGSSATKSAAAAKYIKEEFPVTADDVWPTSKTPIRAPIKTYS